MAGLPQITIVAIQTTMSSRALSSPVWTCYRNRRACRFKSTICHNYALAFLRCRPVSLRGHSPRFSPAGRSVFVLTVPLHSIPVDLMQSTPSKENPVRPISEKMIFEITLAARGWALRILPGPYQK